MSETRKTQEMIALYHELKDKNFSGGLPPSAIPALKRFQEKTVSVTLSREQVNQLALICKGNSDINQLVADALDEYIAAH